jgi:hypothetical protein
VTWEHDNAYRLTSEKRENAGGLLYYDTFTYFCTKQAAIRVVGQFFGNFFCAA